MTAFTRILDLNNAYEASLLDQVLNDHNIPHAIISTGDSAFGSIESLEFGYGYLEAPEDHREQIMEFYRQITNQ